MAEKLSRIWACLIVHGDHEHIAMYSGPEGLREMTCEQEDRVADMTAFAQTMVTREKLPSLRVVEMTVTKEVAVLTPETESGLASRAAAMMADTTPGGVGELLAKHIPKEILDKLKLAAKAEADGTGLKGLDLSGVFPAVEALLRENILPEALQRAFGSGLVDAMKRKVEEADEAVNAQMTKNKIKCVTCGFEMTKGKVINPEIAIARGALGARKGDATICTNCAEVMRFDDESLTSLHKMTPEEWVELPLHLRTRLKSAQDLVMSVNARRSGGAQA